MLTTQILAVWPPLQFHIGFIVSFLVNATRRSHERFTLFTCAEAACSSRCRWLAFTLCFPARLAKLGVCWPVGPNRRLHGNHMYFRLLRLRSQVFLVMSRLAIIKQAANGNVHHNNSGYQLQKKKKKHDQSENKLQHKQYTPYPE